MSSADVSRYHLRFFLSPVELRGEGHMPAVQEALERLVARRTTGVNINRIVNGRIVEHASMQGLLGRLHTETFVLDLRDELDSIDPIPGFELQLRDGTTLEAAVTRESGVNALFAALSDRGIVVTSLRNKQNRLEQLFIDMVRDGVDMEGHAA